MYLIRFCFVLAIVTLIAQADVAREKAVRQELLKMLEKKVNETLEKRRQLEEMIKRLKQETKDASPRPTKPTGVRHTTPKRVVPPTVPRPTVAGPRMKAKPTTPSRSKAKINGDCKDLSIYPFQDEEGNLIPCDSYVRLHGNSICSDVTVKTYCCYSCAPSAEKAKLKVEPEKMAVLALSPVHDSEDIV